MWSVAVNPPVKGEPIIADGRVIFDSGDWNTFCGNSTMHPCPPGYVDAYGIPLGGQSISLGPAPWSVSNSPNIFGSGSASGGMPTYNYTWNWGDGTIGYGRTAGHLYDFSGHAIATLTVTDAAGGVTQRFWYVDTNVYYPSLCSNIFVLTVCASVVVVPCWVAWCNNLYTGSIQTLSAGAWVVAASGSVSWDWHWGDGSGDSTVQFPNHLYASHGTYTITVTATDSERHQASKSFQLEV